ncbi:MAG: septum formation initiator family protein [Proteobacteria bacterium]|nr:septum formation initiator family protein [Pseudomonadota bacterium]
MRVVKRKFGDKLLEKGPYCLFVWATLVLLLSMYRGQSSVSLYLSLKDSEVVLSKTVDALRAENIRLEGEIHKIKTSKDYARKLLRDRYHITELDEKIVYFAD